MLVLCYIYEHVLWSYLKYDEFFISVVKYIFYIILFYRQNKKYVYKSYMRNKFYIHLDYYNVRSYD